MLLRMALMATTHAESLQGTVMGVAMSGVAFGNLLGPPLGGVLGYYINLWVPFFLVALILFIDVVLQVIYVFLPYKQREQKNTSRLSHNNTLMTTLLLDSSVPQSSSEVVASSEISPFSTMWTLLQRVDIVTVVAAAIVSNSSIGVIEPLVPR